MEKVCFVCLQPSRLKCSRCDVVQYCGKECQKKDWKVHKHNCKDRSIYCEDDSDDNTAIFNKAKKYIDQGYEHRAEKSLRKLLETSKRLQHTHYFLVGCLNLLSAVLINQRKFVEASEIAQESLELCRSHLFDWHPETLTAMNNLAITYVRLKQFDEAHILLNECIETSTRIYGNDYSGTIVIMTSLGDLYIDQGMTR